MLENDELSQGEGAPLDDDGYLCGGSGWVAPNCMFISIRLLHAIDFSVSCLLFDSAHVCTTHYRRTFDSHETGQKQGRLVKGIMATPRRQ